MASKPRFRWNPEIEREVCSRIALGQSTREISGIDGLPHRDTIFQHCIDSKDFADQYARAKEKAMEKIAEDIVEIADEIPLAEFPMADGTTAQRVDNGAIQRNKLRVDTRKWIMSKLAPKKYGDSSKVELSGEVNIGLAERIAKARARES